MNLTLQRPRLPALTLLAAMGITFMLQLGSVGAIGLQQAYQDALHNDPTYQGAFYDSQAGKEYVNIGRSALLPNLSGDFERNKNRADISTLGSGNQTYLTHPIYYGEVAMLNLRQPLFSPESLARYRQGVAQTNYSARQFDFQGQELALRVAGAYFDALFAHDQVLLSTAQRDVYVEQRHINDRMLERGEGTKTDMLETQAKLDLSEAQLLESKDNEVTARDTLAGVVGHEVIGLDSLRPNFPIKSLEPRDFAGWKILALDHNSELAAQKFVIESSQHEIQKDRAGFLPRLDLVASYGRQNDNSINTYHQQALVRTVGIQLTVPLYSGGAVSATARQAVAVHEHAKVDLIAKTDKVMIDLRKQYNLVLSSVGRIEALFKAVSSGELLTVATKESIKGGVRINLDLLNAQQQLYTAKRDLAQALYGYLLGTLRLRAAAGILSADDMQEMSMYFR